MAWIDIALLALMALSVLLGLVRGMVRELLALAGWILGIVLAVLYAADAAAWLPAHWPQVGRVAAAGAAIVLVTVIVSAFAGWGLRSLVVAVRLGGLDRLLGAVFGLARGLLAVALLVVLGGATALPKQDWWHQSQVLSLAQVALRWSQPWWPPGLAERVAAAPAR